MLFRSGPESLPTKSAADASSDLISESEDLRVVYGRKGVRSSLSEIKSLLASAALFVGNDSGPAHMAAAFGLPSVVVFGPSDPILWGPWRTAGEVVAAPGGIGDVTVAQVLDALQRLRVPA